MTTLTCHIFSDVICPWCLIGWTNLKSALETLEGKVELDVTWLPFQLNPDMPAEGMDRQAYLSAKFGGEDGARDVYSRVEQAAIGAGIPVQFNKIQRTPSTMAAHRLVLLADKTGKGTQIKESLFRRYFIEGEDIGSTDVLAEAASECGMDGAEVRTYLAGEEGIEPVRAWQGEAQRLGISGVPFFIVQQKHGLSGAQPPDVFARALTEISAEAAA